MFSLRILNELPLILYLSSVAHHAKLSTLQHALLLCCRPEIVVGDVDLLSKIDKLGVPLCILSSVLLSRHESVVVFVAQEQLRQTERLLIESYPAVPVDQRPSWWTISFSVLIIMNH